MFKKTTIYLDTSVINFLFADDAPEKKEATIDLFENFIKVGIYETYISRFVTDEINQNPNEVEKANLLKVIPDYFIEFLEPNDIDEIEYLANAYLSEGIIPPKKLYDALHIACSVIHQVDYLVSWNYKHLANVNRERKIIALNTKLNYLHNFRIITPFELLDYEN